MAHEAVIEVDPSLEGGDTGKSDYGSSGYNTSTASLTSSVQHYVFENGRRYHAYYGIDKNPLPTDEVEQDRMDLAHEISLKLHNGALYKAPLSAPNLILDIGTGTGIWCIDMADEYPMAEIIGTDLSPIQPAWIPPNVRFEVDDVEKDWTYRADSFDFIHARNIGQAIGDWAKLMSQIYKATKPGGYVELSEWGGAPQSDDDTMADDNPLKGFLDLLSDAMAKAGKPFPEKSTLVQRLRKAGFVDIVVAREKVPLGPWPKDPRLKAVGAMNLLSGQTGYHAYGMAVFTRILGMDKDTADRICKDALKAAHNKRNHIYTSVNTYKSAE